MASVSARRDWMLSVLEKGDWNNVPSESSNPRRAIRSLAARFIREARTLAKASNVTARKALQKELDELNARLSLAKSLDGVLALLGRLKGVKALEACRRDLNTRAISDQSKAFASSAVTTTLRAALNDEFKALGIGHVQAVLKERGSKGKTLHQLVLNLPLSARLDHVLSEGEQRAIALGSFLAELRLASHKGAIVLDDPVSSLDHSRRGRVAKRLVKEASTRQVLIFTHEVVFLYQLQEECQKSGLQPMVSFLQSDNGTHGHVSEGLPWAHKSFGERVDALEKRQKHFEKLPWPPAPSEALDSEMIRQYSFLRATIERIVQDLVLNGTVQRFRDYIEVNKLKQVVGIPQSEVDEVFRLYQRCHDIIEAHDPSSAKDEPPPSADDFKKDIDDLKALIAIINTRRNPPKLVPVK
jgi:ABC-type dipeptide/oligopeptide/nickel transport system ATPase subunit